MEKELKTVGADEIRPYPNNPRINRNAIKDTAESIRQVGYVSPIVVDENMVILAGHTRYEAAKSLEYRKIEVLQVSGMSDGDKRKFRILDNKVGEKSTWDFDLLEMELEDLDFDDYDFDFNVAKDFDWNDVLDLDEDSYKEPEHERLRCPVCGAVDYKIHFVKVRVKDDEEKSEEKEQ